MGVSSKKDPITAMLLESYLGDYLKRTKLRLPLRMGMGAWMGVKQEDEAEVVTLDYEIYKQLKGHSQNIP